MIVRFNIDEPEPGSFDYTVSHEGEALFADAGLASIEACIVAATEGLGAEPVGAEVAFKAVISGTYPLATLALATSQIAAHARNSTGAIEEVTR